MIDHEIIPADPTIAVVAVIYSPRPTPFWVQIMLKSLRTCISEELICVDNNRNPVAGNWLRDQGITVLPGDGYLRTHGSGLDILAEWCREHNKSTMVVIEPDCLIEGRRWFNNLVKSVKNGAAMASGHRTCFGPLHPCPSAWNVSQIPGSFSVQERGRVDPRLFSYPKLLEWLESTWKQQVPHHIYELFFNQWDAGMANWYMLASSGKGAEFVEAPDIVHYFSGSYREPQEHDVFDAKLRRYLD